MRRDGESLDNPKERLSARNRWVVAGVLVLALGAAVSAFFSSFHGATLFGEEPNLRESSVASQSLWVLLWALASPLCCWAVLRGGPVAFIGAVVWVALLGLCRPWWWPVPPVDRFDPFVKPLWQTELGVIPWTLLVVSLLTGLAAGWRHEARTVRLGAAGAVLVVAILAALSFANLLRHAQDEEEEFLESTAATRSSPF